MEIYSPSRANNQDPEVVYASEYRTFQGCHAGLVVSSNSMIIIVADLLLPAPGLPISLILEKKIWYKFNSFVSTFSAGAATTEQLQLQQKRAAPAGSLTLLDITQKAGPSVLPVRRRCASWLTGERLTRGWRTPGTAAFAPCPPTRNKTHQQQIDMYEYKHCVY